MVDTARAVFDVDDYEHFVTVQSETAVRHLARSYPYDDHGDDQSALTLTGDEDLIAATLSDELQRRLDAAGVHVIEARLTDLAYSPEIAEAMLRRQQASAIVAARFQIVAGAVSMVRLALEAHRGGRTSSTRRRAQGHDGVEPADRAHERPPDNPVVNVGTLNR